MKINTLFMKLKSCTKKGGKKKIQKCLSPAGFEPGMGHHVFKTTSVLNPLSHTMERQYGNCVSPRMTTFN